MEVGSLSRIDEMFERLSPVLSVKDLTDILGKDKATVDRWLKKGELPGILIESTWVIYRDEVKDYLLSRHNQSGAATRESVGGTSVNYGEQRPTHPWSGRAAIKDRRVVWNPCHTSAAGARSASRDALVETGTGRSLGALRQQYRGCFSLMDRCRRRGLVGLGPR